MGDSDPSNANEAQYDALEKDFQTVLMELLREPDMERFRSVLLLDRSPACSLPAAALEHALTPLRPPCRAPPDPYCAAKSTRSCTARSSSPTRARNG